MNTDRRNGSDDQADFAKVLQKLEEALEGLDALGLKAAGARLSLVIEELRGFSGDRPA